MLERGSPPRKRARPDTEVTKDEEFWYEDGTIILIAQNVEFRVYKGPLIRHSPVFYDMFSFPQPATEPSEGSGSGAVDCPTVHLFDSPHELRHVLRVFMCGHDLDPLGIQAPTIHVISAWIRLGQKYQVDSLVTSGIEVLKRYYPVEFSATPDCNGPIPDDRPWSLTGIHAIGVVNLARLTGETDLLLTALLECCTLGAELIHGYEREDGTRECLSPEDLARCYTAKARLVCESASAISVTLARCAPAPNCTSWDHCDAVIDQLRFHFRVTGLKALPADVLLQETGIIDEYIGRGDYYSLCQSCMRQAESMMFRERENLWAALPEILDVPGWLLDDED